MLKVMIGWPFGGVNGLLEQSACEDSTLPTLHNGAQQAEVAPESGNLSSRAASKNIPVNSMVD